VKLVMLIWCTRPPEKGECRREVNSCLWGPCACEWSKKEVVPDGIKEIFRCRECKGEGKVVNPYFEDCMKSGLTPEELYDCKFCPDPLVKERCNLGEILTCPICDGTGYEVLTWQEFIERLKAKLEVQG